MGAVVETTEVPVVEEKEYRYFITDENNRPLGGEQVIKYKTDQELVEKLKEQNVNSMRLNRKLNRDLRLGNIPVDTIPENSVVYEEPIEYKPRELTIVEREQLSRDLLDPEKFNAARDMLFESAFGQKPEVLSSRLSSLELDNKKRQVAAEVDIFLRLHPEFYKCVENKETMLNWMVKNHLAPVLQNFEYAYTQLEAMGLLLKAPIVREEVPANKTEQTPASQPGQEQNSRITTEEPATRVVGASSGITKNQASNIAPDNTPRGYTQHDIDIMPSEVYKRKLLTERGFAEQVNALEAAKKARNVPTSIVNVRG